MPRIAFGALFAAGAAPCIAADASSYDLFVHVVDIAGAPVQPALVAPSNLAASQRGTASTPGFGVQFFPWRHGLRRG